MQDEGKNATLKGLNINKPRDEIGKKAAFVSRQPSI